VDLEELRKKSTEDMTPEEIAFLPDYDKAIRGLIYDPAIYDADWFRLQSWQHHWIQKIMGWFIGEYGPLESSLDLGAGDGYYSHVLAEMGADPAVAVEVSGDALEVMTDQVNGIVHDLREPLDLNRTFDLIVCLEVAEHLPPSASDTLCDTIARHCAGYLIFTAAPPGQGGHGHCNLQPFKFWKDRLESRGVIFRPRETTKMRVAWLSRNITMFEGKP
jgi:SAM-dependent methyltransferase